MEVESPPLVTSAPRAAQCAQPHRDRKTDGQTEAPYRACPLPWSPHPSEREATARTRRRIFSHPPGFSRKGFHWDHCKLVQIFALCGMWDFCCCCCCIFLPKHTVVIILKLAKNKGSAGAARGQHSCLAPGPATLSLGVVGWEAVRAHHHPQLAGPQPQGLLGRRPSPPPLRAPSEKTPRKGPWRTALLVLSHTLFRAGTPLAGAWLRGGWAPRECSGKTGARRVGCSYGREGSDSPRAHEANHIYFHGAREFDSKARLMVGLLLHLYLIHLRER